MRNLVTIHGTNSVKMFSFLGWFVCWLVGWLVGRSVCLSVCGLLIEHWPVSFFYSGICFVFLSLTRTDAGLLH